jgi:hypothetical protein
VFKVNGLHVFLVCACFRVAVLAVFLDPPLVVLTRVGAFSEFHKRTKRSSAKKNSTGHTYLLTCRHVSACNKTLLARLADTAVGRQVLASSDVLAECETIKQKLALKNWKASKFDTLFASSSCNGE